MLLSLIYFLPCIISLLWFVSFILKKKSYRQRLFCYAEGTSTIFYAIMGMYFFPDADYATMVRMESICVPAGALFPVFVIGYLYTLLTGNKPGSKVMYLLCIPSIAYAVSVNQTFYLMGFQRAAEISSMFAAGKDISTICHSRIDHLYHFITYDLFMIIMACYILILLGLCIGILHKQGYRFGDICRFFFRGRATTHPRIMAVMFITGIIQIALLLSLSSIYFKYNVMAGVSFMIAFATVKHFAAHLEFYSNDARPVTLYELSHLTLFSYVTETDETGAAPDATTAEETVATPEEQTVNPAQIKIDRRIEQFQKLMEEEQIWKNEDLTAASICDMLNIGRTTFTSLVSQHYNTTFRELINSYRIEEAKAFMTANPEATQETIAQHCGFKNAQYFNTQFKKIVGNTPAMWLAGNSQSTDEEQPTK